MKRLMLTLCVLPFFAGCWWNEPKKDVVESTPAQEVMLPESPSEAPAEENSDDDATPADEAVSNEDDK